MRIFGVAVLAAIVYVLYLTSNTRAAQNSPDFYTRTKEALDREKGSYAHRAPSLGVGDEEDAVLAAALAGRLKDAESAAKNAANTKSPRPQSLSVQTTSVAEQDAGSSEKATVDRNVAGRKKYPRSEEHTSELQSQ